MTTRRMKSTGVLAAGVALSMMMTACGGGNTDTKTGASGGGDTSGATLNVVLVDNVNNRGISELAPEFEKATGIKVNVNVLGQDVAEKRMQLDFIGKTGDLDVAYMSFTLMQKWVKAGWVHPLDDFVKASPDVNIDDFAKAPIDSLSINGKLWALPSFAETGLMAYRTDIFEKNGITAPPDTWDQLKEVAQKIHSKETSAVALRAKRGQGINMFIFPSMMWGFGGSYFKDYPNDMTPVLDRTENVKALEYYMDLVKNYSPSGAGNYSFAEVISAYQQGNAAITVDGTSIITQLFEEGKSKYAAQTKVALVPQGPSGRSPMIAVHGLAISESSKNKEAAFKFIKWATSADIQKRIALKDYNLDFTRVSVSEDPDIKKKYNFDNGNLIKLRTESLNIARPDYRPLIPEWAEIGDLIAAQVNGAVNGGVGAEAALKEANKQVTEVIKNAGYIK
ncbi:ABC transporter substrate-binding protein [Paenibacillus puerhi]|uniref:ABC transporter substrate-binding protein n=1 Tax=Paenibacillus puerhi TaxID=2692622 RepID=UPI0013588EF9|nr:sugar ABC transporter substrate-binding protein [Paenibacillus puerhi]